MWRVRKLLKFDYIRSAASIITIRLLIPLMMTTIFSHNILKMSIVGRMFVYIRTP